MRFFFKFQIKYSEVSQGQRISEIPLWAGRNSAITSQISPFADLRAKNITFLMNKRITFYVCEINIRCYLITSHFVLKKFLFFIIINLSHASDRLMKLKAECAPHVTQGYRPCPREYSILFSWVLLEKLIKLKKQRSDNFFAVLCHMQKASRSWKSKTILFMYSKKEVFHVSVI